MPNIPPEPQNYGAKYPQYLAQQPLANNPKANTYPSQPGAYQPPTGPRPPMPPSGSKIPPSGTGAPPAAPAPPAEKSYMENIFLANRGKIGTFYFTFQNNKEWNAKVVKGILIASGRDYIIVKEVVSDHRWLLPTLNFDFAVFDEQLDL